MVRYLVQPQNDSDDMKVRYKYAFIACEIFSCEIDSIYSTLLDDEELMKTLFAYLDSEELPSSLISGYFSRVVSCLLLRRTQDCMEYLKRNQSVLEKLVMHISSTSIADVLMRLVGADEQIMIYHPDAVYWLAETSLLEEIISCLAPGQSSQVYANATDVLCAIARTAPSPLSQQLNEAHNVSKLIDYAIDGEEKATGDCLTVLATMLGPKRMVVIGMGGMMGSMDMMDEDSVAEVPRATIKAVCSRFSDLVALLAVKDKSKVVSTTYGILQPPLGIVRLRAVQFFSALLYSGEVDALEAAMKHKLVDKCLALMFRYPFNNTLHHEVEAILCFALDGGESYALQILDRKGCDLIGTLVTASETVTPEPRPGDYNGRCKQPLRAGYMGHITRIANKLLSVTEQYDSILDLLAKDDRWQSWMEGTLRPRNDVENVGSWQCGRPGGMDTGFDSGTFPPDLGLMTGMGSGLPDRYEHVIDEEDEEDEGEEKALVQDDLDGDEDQQPVGAAGPLDPTDTDEDAAAILASLDLHSTAAALAARVSASAAVDGSPAPLLASRASATSTRAPEATPTSEEHEPDAYNAHDYWKMDLGGCDVPEDV
eukprot:jgi/Pico_ML_1/50880/g2010.t1